VADINCVPHAVSYPFSSEAYTLHWARLDTAKLPYPEGLVLLTVCTCCCHEHAWMMLSLLQSAGNKGVTQERAGVPQQLAESQHCNCQCVLSLASPLPAAHSAVIL
jgi:hypothetical protein